MILAKTFEQAVFAPTHARECPYLRWPRSFWPEVHQRWGVMECKIWEVDEEEISPKICREILALKENKQVK